MPPEAMGDAMSETFSPQEAARVVASASRFEEGLVQRTEGLTQMVWGIVTPALFVTYGFASLLDAAEWVYAILWVPWVGLGTLTTVALWRSAALSRPPGAPFEKPRGIVLRMLGLTVAFTAVFFFLRPDGPTLPLAVVGGMWALMAALNVIGASPLGRGLWAFCGLALVATAAGLALFRAPIEVSGFLSIVVPGVVPVASGLWQTLRG